MKQLAKILKYITQNLCPILLDFLGKVSFNIALDQVTFCDGQTIECSVTGFSEISPLWLINLNIWQNSLSLFCFGQYCNSFLAFFVLLQIFTFESGKM